MSSSLFKSVRPRGGNSAVSAGPRQRPENRDSASSDAGRTTLTLMRQSVHVPERWAAAKLLHGFGRAFWIRDSGGGRKRLQRGPRRLRRGVRSLVSDRVGMPWASWWSSVRIGQDRWQWNDNTDEINKKLPRSDGPGVTWSDTKRTSCGGTWRSQAYQAFSAGFHRCWRFSGQFPLRRQNAHHAGLFAGHFFLHAHRGRLIVWTRRFYQIWMGRLGAALFEKYWPGLFQAVCPSQNEPQDNWCSRLVFRWNIPISCGERYDCQLTGLFGSSPCLPGKGGVVARQNGPPQRKPSWFRLRSREVTSVTQGLNFTAFFHSGPPWERVIDENSITPFLIPSPVGGRGGACLRAKQNFQYAASPPQSRATLQGFRWHETIPRRAPKAGGSIKHNRIWAAEDVVVLRSA